MNKRKTQLTELLQLNPNDAFLMFALGKEFENEGDTSQAIVWYRNLIERHPDYSGAYYHLASALSKMSQKVEAQKIIDQGIEICTQLKAMHDLNELKNLKQNLLLDLLD